jgi:peptidoglycan/xylan/chitin deacetylase (PgdA/CDA1 family)
LKQPRNSKLFNWYKRNASAATFRRPIAIRSSLPVVSFTFDDFPQSAFHLGGAILKSHGLAGTYYASLGLMGLDSPSGRVCTRDDLVATLEQGHELGCHTFSHLHSWDTESDRFEQSIVKNQAALAEIIPTASFRSFAYPLSIPRPSVKRVCERHFVCCRSGGQTFNAGTADLNQLSAYFLEKAGENMQAVSEVIEQNKRSNGWLIFATHDVSRNPSPYGCSPKFFESVVRYAIESGARILPVVAGLEAVQRAPLRS